MQVQKDDDPYRKSDRMVGSSGFARKNAAKLGRTAMRGVHYRHVCAPIASHLQHDYLALIEGK